MREFYEKIGRRYKRVGIEFSGFPCDGIWQVRDGANGCTLLIHPDEKPPIFAVVYRAYRDDLCKYIQSKWKENNNMASLMDEMTWACDYFAEVAAKQTKGENK